MLTVELRGVPFQGVRRGGRRLIELHQGMADETDNLVLEHLRHARGQLDGMAHDISGMMTAQSGVLSILASHDARMLRIEERLDRIERRLDLVETPAAG